MKSSVTSNPLSHKLSVKGWPEGLRLPAPIQWGVLFLLPLSIAGYWLVSKLSMLPASSWDFTLYPGALLAAILLVPLNWWLESVKWAELLPWAPLGRRMREVLYGTAWSMVGPLRLGAGIGRLAAMRPKERNMALRAFATASVSQWWCTITAAAIGLLCSKFYLAGCSVLFISAVTIGLYFGWSPGFWHRIKGTPLLRQWGMSRKIATVRRRRALNLSVARFFVMLFQFVLLLNAFGHLSVLQHSVERFFIQGQGAALTWGLTSLAPMPAFGDLGLREAAAIAAISAPTPHDMTAIVGATFTLWLINLFIPAMVGVVWHGMTRRKSAAKGTIFGA